MQPNNKPNRPPRNNPAPKQQPGQQSGPRRGRQQSKGPSINSSLTTSRGQAVRAQRRSHADAQRIANQYVAAADNGDRPKRANVIDDRPRLKVIGLGGMDGGGSK
ncbi:MAG TPA: hypothetical protein VMU97_01370, partial [Candidatus Dormibacteraeota bacterium]|nr:hypothetical protein [Candidatus Dormibacteraeota bacterium]